MSGAENPSTRRERHAVRERQFLVALAALRAEISPPQTDQKARIRATLDRIAAASAADLAESEWGTTVEAGAMADYASRYILSGNSLKSLSFSPESPVLAPQEPHRPDSAFDQDRAARRSRIAALLIDIHQHLDGCIVTDPLLASRLESRKNRFLKVLAEMRQGVCEAPPETPDEVEIGQMYDEVAAYAAAHAVESQFGKYAPEDALTPYLGRHLLGTE